MANMQTYYVDLSLDNSYVGEGTELNKYSWGDVLRWFARLNASPSDTSGTLDSGNPFDMSSLSVDFRMTGKKSMTTTDVIAVSGIQFFMGAMIRFTSHNPKENGVAVWSFGSSVSIDTFIQVTGCTAPDIRIQGVLIRGEGSLNTLLGVEGLNGSATLENSVAVLSDRTTLIKLTADYGKMVVAGNTIVVRAISNGQHVLFDNAGSSAKASLSHNIAGQVSSSGSALVGLSSLADGTVLASGNVWAVRPNGAPYTGAYPSASSTAPDVFGQALSDVIYGDSTLDSTGTAFTSILDADNSERGCSEFSLSFARAKHTGKAIACIPTQGSTTSVGDAVGYIDILGRFRSGVIDAGAIQKSDITTEDVIHVDLSLPTAVRFNAMGTEADPIGVADWRLDLVTRAPVDNSVVYAIRNNMGLSDAPISLKLGAGESYIGAGSVTSVGWKTFNRALPKIKVESIEINQSLSCRFENIHLEWTGNSDLFSYPATSVLANDKKIQLVNTSVRSDVGNTGRFVVLSTQSPVLEMAGISATFRHTSPVAAASGYIAIDSDLNHVIALSAFRLAGQTKLLTGQTLTTMTGVAATSTAGTVTVVGVTPTASVFEGDALFIAASASNPDFRLTEDSVALGIIATEDDLPSSIRSLVKTDCRNLERSAFPFGSKEYDAGAYESGFKVYPELHLYADLSKTSTGHVGSMIDKFSYADLVAWIASLKGTTITRKYVVHLLRRIAMDSSVLDLSDLEGNPHCGGIAFVTDNGRSAATLVSAYAPVISALRTEGINLDITRLVVGSQSGFGPVALSAKNGTENTIAVKNSIFAWKHSKIGFVVTRTGTLDATDYISINTTSFVRSENSTDDATDFASIIESITSDETISPLVRVETIEYGTAYRICPKTSVDITVNSSANITSTRATALIEGDADWTVKLAGVSISDSFSRNLSLQTKVVSASPVSFVACAVESTENGVSKLTSIADAPVDVIGLARPTSATLVGVAGVTVSDRPSSVAVFQNAALGDFDQDDFKLVGAASTASIITGASLPSWATSLNLDMTGSLRFTAPTESVDAGALEYNPIVPTGTYAKETQAPTVNRTKLGQALRLRAEAEGPLSVLNPVTSGTRSINPFDFKIVGYQLLNAGYIYWQPTRPTELNDFSGAQATATIVVGAGNSFDATSIIELSYLGRLAKISYVHGADTLAGFTAGTTPEETAAGIVKILRSAQVDDLPLESVLWVEASGSTITLTAKLIGSLGNTITVSASGTGLSGTTMTGGEDPTDPTGQVYPVSGWVPFDKNELPDPYSISFALKLGVGQANAAFGAIVVVGQVTASPLAAEVGTVFPFAVVQMPLESKHERKTISCRVLFT